MNLREIREERDILQYNVAKILGVSNTTYCLWESERSVIPLNRLITFCNYFNISLDYALGLKEEKTYPHLKPVDFEIHRQRLKRVRKSNKYTQDELAKILNTDNGVISRYENGKTLILTSFLIVYAKTFNISCDYILGRIDEPIPLKNLILNK